MLLRFAVENFLSIRDQQELLLTASKQIKDRDDILIDCGTPTGRRALPVIVIYGANASGKSNLLRAFNYMQRAILFSHSQGSPKGGVPRDIHALDPDSADKPSVFEIDFVLDGVRYHYGFSATDEHFEEEWLFSFPKGKQRRLFEREGKDFEFGDSLTGQKTVISQLTRPNSLFLSAAAQNDHPELTTIANYITAIRSARHPAFPWATKWEESVVSEHKRNILDFMNDIEVGITDVRKKERELSKKDIELREALNNALNEIGKPTQPLEDKVPSLEIAHSGKNGESIFLRYSNESAGTKNLITKLPMIFDALESGQSLFIDELNDSLHTLACEKIIALFSSKATNPKGAQLVTTTHDTNLLRSGFLRRDQIWFTEKDSEGATHLYPLTDFRTRKDDNLARGYLEGRYGAVPFSGSLPVAPEEVK